jgi:hypothetical protein
MTISSSGKPVIMMDPITITGQVGIDTSTLPTMHTSTQTTSEGIKPTTSTLPYIGLGVGVLTALYFFTKK